MDCNKDSMDLKRFIKSFVALEDLFLSQKNSPDDTVVMPSGLCLCVCAWRLLIDNRKGSVLNGGCGV